jgi:predicted GTPase
VVVINKIDSANEADLAAVIETIETVNPEAEILTARSDLFLDGPSVGGKRVVVVEDGPTLTHGGMTYGAGVVAARRFGAGELIDPEPVAVGSIRTVLERYPDLEPLVPAMGYGETQMAELKATLEATDAEVVLAATPIDLRGLLDLEKPVTRVRYELAQVDGRPLGEILAEALESDD